MVVSLVFCILVPAVLPVRLPASERRIERRFERWELEVDGIVRRTAGCRMVAGDSDTGRTEITVPSRWKGSSCKVKRASLLRAGIESDSVEFFERRGMDGVLTTVFRLPPLRPGDVVEYEVEESCPAGASARLGFTPVHLFSAESPVGEDVFEIALPRGGKLNWITRRMGKYAKPEVRREDSKVVWRWRMMGLAPLPREPMAPAPAMDAPLVRAGVLDEWKPVSDWLSAHLARNKAPSAKTKRMAVRLGLVGAGAPGLAGKIVRVRAFVSGRVGARAMQAQGIEDFAGHDADTVIDRGCGDCVDRAILASALLDACGEKARPVFICTTDYRRFEPDIPTPYCGNHAIVMVGDGDDRLFFDPADTFRPPGCLPPNQQGVIAYSPLDDGFFRTPVSGAGDNGLYVFLDLRLDRSGRLFGRYTVFATGEKEVLVKRLTARGVEPAGIAAGLLGMDAALYRFDCPSLRFLEAGDGDREGVPDFSPLPGASPWKGRDRALLAGRIRSVAGVFRKIGDMVLVELPGFACKAGEVMAVRRSRAMVYPFAVDMERRMRLSLPGGAVPVRPPADLEMRCAGVLWSRRVDASQPSCLVVSDVYRRDTLVVPAGSYGNYRKLLMRRASAGKPVLVLSMGLSRALPSSAPEPRSAGLTSVAAGPGGECGDITSGGEHGASPVTAPGEACRLLVERVVRPLSGGGWKLAMQEELRIGGVFARTGMYVPVRFPPGAVLTSLSCEFAGDGGPRFSLGGGAVRPGGSGQMNLFVPGTGLSGRLAWRASFKQPSVAAGGSGGILPLGGAIAARRVRLLLDDPGRDDVDCALFVGKGSPSVVRRQLPNRNGIETRKRVLYEIEDLPARCSADFLYGKTMTWPEVARLLDGRALGAGKRACRKMQGDGPTGVPSAGLVSRLRRCVGAAGRLFFVRPQLDRSLVSPVGFSGPVALGPGGWLAPGGGLFPGVKFPEGLDRLRGYAIGTGSFTGALQRLSPPAASGHRPGGLVVEDVDLRLMEDGRVKVRCWGRIAPVCAARIALCAGVDDADSIPAFLLKKIGTECALVEPASMSSAFNASGSAFEYELNFFASGCSVNLPDGRWIVRPTFPWDALRVPGVVVSSRCRIRSSMAGSSPGRIALEGAPRGWRLQKPDSGVVLWEVVAALDGGNPLVRPRPLIEFVPGTGYSRREWAKNLRSEVKHGSTSSEL